jgi:uncharacterized RDD family membrane protein YckC
MADFNPYQTPSAYVEDVAGEVEGELAGRGARLGAAFIDGIIIFPIALLLWYVFAPGIFSGHKPTFLVSLSVGLFALAIWVALNFSLLARNGQTIGKKMLGIKIVRTDNTACGVWRIAGRRLLIPGLINQIPVAGLVFVFVDMLFIFRESRRCIHDLIADTIVIRA